MAALPIIRLTIACAVGLVLNTGSAVAASPRVAVYPWAGVGAVGTIGAPRPDDPAAALAAVQKLGVDTVQLYAADRQPADMDAVVRDARWWSDQGIRSAVVLRYVGPSPARYARWVHTVTKGLAGVSGVRDITVGNELNERAPGPSDGGYPHADAAVSRAIPVARRALDRAGRGDVRVGINWAAGRTPHRTPSLFGTLSPSARRSLSFVAVNVYPGTWSAPTRPTSRTVARSLHRVLALHQRHLRALGRPRLATVIGETGYPTGPGRSEQVQALVMRGVLRTTHTLARRHRITDVRLFGLRDARSRTGAYEEGYGLMHDDYRPKPAYTLVRHWLAAHRPR